MISTAFAFLLALLACGSEAPTVLAPAVEAPKVTSLRVGYVPIADCAHLYAAIDQQFWADHGLDIEAVPLAAGPKVLEALAAGSVDVGFSGIVTLIQARVAGLPFVAVGGAIVEEGDAAAHRLLVQNGSGIRGPKDLRGKTVAVATLRGIDQLVMLEYVGKVGISGDSLKMRELPFPRMEGVLQSKEVDAALAMEPYVSLAVKSGKAQAIANPYIVVAPRTLVSTWVMRSDKGKSETGKAVAATFADAATWISTHDAEIRALVAAHTSVDPTVVSAMPMNKMEAAPALADLEVMIARTKAAGLIDTDVNAADLLVAAEPVVPAEPAAADPVAAPPADGATPEPAVAPADPAPVTPPE